MFILFGKIYRIVLRTSVRVEAFNEEALIFRTSLKYAFHNLFQVFRSRDLLVVYNHDNEAFLYTGVFQLAAGQTGDLDTITYT